MAVTISTGRGFYQLETGVPEKRPDGGIVFAVSLARSDGVERIAFRCRVAAGLAGSVANESPDAIVGRLAKWLGREFEQTREAALKSIRAEHKPLELVFDALSRGPFV